MEEITADSTPTVNATWAWGMDPEPVRMERGSDESFYHANRMGSVERLTDDVATVVESVEYTAHGKPSIGNSAVGNHFLWASGWFDYKARAFGARRAYDPTTTLRYLTAIQGNRLSLGGGSPMLGTPKDVRWLSPEYRFQAQSSESASPTSPRPLGEPCSARIGVDNRTECESCCGRDFTIDYGLETAFVIGVAGVIGYVGVTGTGGAAAVLAPELLHLVAFVELGLLAANGAACLRCRNDCAEQCRDQVCCLPGWTPTEEHRCDQEEPQPPYEYP